MSREAEAETRQRGQQRGAKSLGAMAGGGGGVLVVGILSAGGKCASGGL